MDGWQRVPFAAWVDRWRRARQTRHAGRRRIALALQGGGAFGAFTWGVLDRLLAEDDIAIDAVSGASAGAVNAVVMASGLARGGPVEARAALERFWSSASERGSWSGLSGLGSFGGAAAVAFDLSSRLLSPYQTNPLDINPLRDILASQVDFELLRARAPLRLRIAATNVSDGSARIFTEQELGLNAVLASACLPLVHRAVMIDGDGYWDGGYTANPPILPLIAATDARHLVVVQLSPTRGVALPTSSPRIVRRLGQITFNSPLQRELEALSMLRPLYEWPPALLSPLARHLRQLQVHRIAAEDATAELMHASALDLDWSFLSRLRDHGRNAAEAWISRTFAESPSPGLRTARHSTVTGV
jgi:NTE family protein